MDNLAAIAVSEAHVIERNVVAFHGKRSVRGILFRNIANFVHAIELIADLLGEKRPVVRADQLSVDHESCYKKREGP